MGAWDSYLARASVRGNTIRDASKIRELRFLNRHIPDNLSYHTASIIDSRQLMPGIDRKYCPCEIHDQNVAIINSDNFEIKSIISMPGETLRHGDIVYWMDQYWLITEKDYNTELYAKCKMEQCNYLLRWVDRDGNLFEQWCIVEDGTKYLTGEYEDRNFIVTRGDSRIAVTIPRNAHTALLNRETRLLIDEPNDEHMLAYVLSKPLKLGATYGKEDGVYKFVLQEAVMTDNDNPVLRVADYYKYYDRQDENNINTATESVINPNENTDQSTGKAVWL